MSTEKRFKIWKCSNDSAAGFMVTPDSVVMAGTSKNFIVIDEHGTNIAGPVSMMTSSDQIRQGGLFTQSPDFLQMIPSTITTAGVNTLKPFPPVALFASIAEVMPGLLILMA